MILSNISKLIEKRLHNCLSSFLEQNNCLCNYQFGFRKNHSKKPRINQYDRKKSL